MKLTDSQLVLLNAAAQCEGGEIRFPDQWVTGLRIAMAKRLIAAKLAIGVEMPEGGQVLHRDANGTAFSLAITDAGRAALEGNGKADKPRAAAARAPKATAKKAAKPAPARKAKQAKAGKPAAKERKPRSGTKQDQVIAMLKRKGGATIDEIGKATGWLPHTTRAFVSATLGKKLGHKIERVKADGVSTYRIVG